MDYSEQYKHPEWQKKRLEILQRDEFRCLNCGEKEKELHVHHCYYEKDKKAWNYPGKCYITLCHVCHEKWHRLKNSIDKNLSLLPEQLFNIDAILFILSNYALSSLENILRLVYKEYYLENKQL